jgi:hypothetical protein
VAVKLVDVILEGGQGWIDSMFAENKTAAEIERTISEKLKLCAHGTFDAVDEPDWTIKREKVQGGYNLVVYRGRRALRTELVEINEREGRSVTTLRVWY